MELACIATCAEVIVNYSSDEESSEDEDLYYFALSAFINKQRNKKPTRIQHYVEVTVKSYTATQFQQNFRMTVDAYEVLLAAIGPELKRQGVTGRNTTDIEKQTLAVIWLLATPDSYR